MALLAPSKKLILPWGTVGDAYGTVPQRGPEIIVRQKNRSARRRNLISTWRGLHAQLETDTQRQLTRFFRTITRRVLERLDKAGRVAIVDELFSPAEFGDAFNRVMIPQWAQLTMQGARFESAWIGDTKRQRLHEALLGLVYQLNEGELPPSFHVDLSPAMQEHIREFLRSREVGVWTQVGATVHDRLRRALQRALKDGDNPAQMRKRVNEVLTNAEKYQAARIARTETTGAMNHGQQLEREDIGIERKEWVSTLDIKTRGSQPGDAFNHRAADGKTVGNDEQFTVSGQRLAYPGDSSHGASAGNICNCRCAAVSSFEDEPAVAPQPMRPAMEPESDYSIDVESSANKPATQNALDVIQVQLLSLPDAVRKFLDDKNYTVVVAEDLVDEIAGKKNYFVRGKHVPKSRKIYVAEKVVTNTGVTLRNPSIITTFNHETGHAIDSLGMQLSKKNEFIKLWRAERDAAELALIADPDARRLMSPELSIATGPKELVARAFELIFPNSEATKSSQLIAKYFPRCIAEARKEYQLWLAKQ